MKRIAVGIVLAVLAMGVLIGACGGGGSASQPVSKADVNYENNLLALLRKVYPLPKLLDSSDLKNQIEYATVQSDPNKVEYIAFLNYNGQPYATFAIKGQVSAESTRITAPTKDKCYEGNDNGEFSCVQDQQPDLTGTFFSQSGGGYFAYKTNGALLQWPAALWWMTSDQPFHITAPPQLSINENAPITPTHPHILNGITK